MTALAPSVQSVRGLSSRYTLLFNVQFQHGYYNASGGSCSDFSVSPTPDCAQLMASLGMFYKDHGAGFSVMIDQAAIPAMVNYVASRFAAGPAGRGYWTWLTFLLVPTNPEFVGITSLPITTSLTMQNLHIANLQTNEAKTGLMLGGGGAVGEGALYPLSGASLSVATPAGATAALLDLSGAPVPVATAASGGTTRFTMSGVPFGFYTLAFSDAAGAAVAAPAGTPAGYLYVPDSPRPLCVLDLALTQPTPTTGDAAAFPIPPLAAPPQSGAAPPATVNPVTLTLPFASRSTFWRYYIVSQQRTGSFTADLAISGAAGVSFAKSLEQLPNGDSAVLFAAKKPLPLQQISQFRFKLTGQRKGANGSQDDISVDWLPAAPSAPVWPAPTGDALSGASEIYVYV